MPESELPNGPDAWTDQHILFCGHDGWFTGDVIITPFAVSVISRARNPVTPEKLTRTGLDGTQWHISEVHGGYWMPRKGVFLLPREAVTRLTALNRHRFLKA